MQLTKISQSILYKSIIPVFFNTTLDGSNPKGPLPEDNALLSASGVDFIVEDTSLFSFLTRPEPTGGSGGGGGGGGPSNNERNVNVCKNIYSCIHNIFGINLEQIDNFATLMYNFVVDIISKLQYLPFYRSHNQ